MEMKDSYSRKDFPAMKRVLIQVSSSVVLQDDGTPAVTRIASLIEEISSAIRAGKQIILLHSSGSGSGKKQNSSLVAKLEKLEAKISDYFENEQYSEAAKLQPEINTIRSQIQSNNKDLVSSLCEVVFSQCQTPIYNLTSSIPIPKLSKSINTLLEGGTVPVVSVSNESRSDLIASQIASTTNCDLLIMLSEVDGLYSKQPHDPQPSLISACSPNVEYTMTPYSRYREEFLQSKISAANESIQSGVKAVVLANGRNSGQLTQILKGKKAGTIIVKNVSRDEAQESARSQALQAQAASRTLQSLSTYEREVILYAIADELLAHSDEILEANHKDVEIANQSDMSSALKSRLHITPEKLQTLADGLRQIADGFEPIGKVISRLEVSEGLILQQETAPIGVLLVIFESRPDVLPQVSALAIRSGNGLLLKGGSEARHSNRILHKIIVDAINSSTNGRVDKSLIGLVETREEIANLLRLDDVIDLCIPRGSNELVNYIQNNTKIPVLGHAEGICHVYVDEQADPEKAVRITVDAKINYPAACNAVETILLHIAHLQNGLAQRIVDALKQESVAVFGGPLASAKLGLPPCEDLRHEYGDMSVTVEFIGSVQDAIDHIHTYGSAHTDSIVTEDHNAATVFLNSVDSACVFHNASTRFADGFRFGLGAEVGISTKKIHARGPVGVMGLETTRWKLSSANSHTVSDFSGADKKEYTHRELEDDGTSICQIKQQHC